MLQDQSQDDVLELCRSASMDPSAYKTFALAISTPPRPAPSQPLIDEPCPVAPRMNQLEAGKLEVGIPGPVQTEPSQHSPSSQKLLGDVEADIHSHAEGLSKVLPQQDHRSSLTSSPSFLGNNLSALAAVHERESQPALLPMVSGVGGCGTTTILAALGRALSIIGERVLLVDARGPSTLDCFYESKSEKSSLLLSTDPLSQLEGRVHVVRTQVQTTGAPQSYPTKFHRAAAGLRGHIDRILVASAEWLPPSLGRTTWAGGICLVILTPEMRSLLKVPSMLQAVNEHSRQANVEIEPWFLLNRFDESSSAHIAVRSQLSAQLGSRLLPFSIPETHLVEQALSLGISVLDLAPQSDFADACFDLAEWYRTTPKKLAGLASLAQETQLV